MTLKSPQRYKGTAFLFAIRIFLLFYMPKLLLCDLWKMDVDLDKPIKDQYANQWKEVNEDLNSIKEKNPQIFI